MNSPTKILNRIVTKISDLKRYNPSSSAAWARRKFCFLILLVPVSIFGQSISPENLWPTTTMTSRPWSRWWWMGSAVDSTNLKNLLTEYHDQGLGGLEIAPIYGAKGYENRYLSYLSPQWQDMLRYTVSVADSLGMGIDLTQGTGWPFGGPWVSREEAASRLLTLKYELLPGQELNETLVPDDPRLKEAILQAVLASRDDKRWMDLTHLVDENHRLQWNSGDDKWQIIAYFSGKTGQKVKRAAPGGEGFVLDHYSKSAVDNYLEVYDSAFHEPLPPIRALYNDSYEVYGSDWTKSFLNEFSKRRGYDLKPHLIDLFSDSPTDTIVRLKSDYRETLHELLLENFTRNWTKWAHERGRLTKNQAHGSPANLLDLYGAVDIPECETFGSTYFPIPGLRRDSADVRNVDPDPVMLKFASSAAHVTGKNLVSSETFTWLGEHFKSSFSQMKPELEQAYLAGVNHMFYHGVTYSPKDVPWPGWLFYASLNLTPANSLWPHFSDFNRFVTRCQSMLQAGRSDNDLLIYWPVYDVWADSGQLLNMLTVHHIDEWLHPTSFYKWSTHLIDRGYLLDFISDDQINNSQAGPSGINTNDGQAGYKTLIIPASQFLRLSTLERILDLVHDGATVLFENKPGDVPGLHDHVERKNRMEELWSELPFKPVKNSDQKAAPGVLTAKWGKGVIVLTADIVEGLKYQGIEREAITDSGIQLVRRKTDLSSDYFLVNHTASDVDENLLFNASGETIIFMDPVSGQVGRAINRVENGKTYVRVQLKSGQSIFVRFTDEILSDVEDWKYRDNARREIEISGPWKLTFTQGGPEIPEPVTLSQLVSWTELDDVMTGYFSGQAIYESTFEAEDLGNYLLSLGEVRESCRIWINGKEVGYAWSIPYEIDVSQYVVEGQNTLRIEVANLMANRIRYLDRQGISWRNYHEINFVNIDYQSFDASRWNPVPSGLLGPVRLIRF